VKSLATVALRVVLTALVVAVVAWSVAAIWIDGPKNRELAGMLCVVVGAGSLLLLLVVQPWWWSLATAVVPFVVVLAWWLSIAPSNDRDWQADVARLPSATIAGDRVTIRNVRNFAYPSAAPSSSAGTRAAYDLGRIDGFDMFLSYWGTEDHRAHDLELAVLRRSASGDLDRDAQEERAGLLARARLLPSVRALLRGRRRARRHRGPDGAAPGTMQLYRVRGDPAFARALLLEYLEEVNRLAREPQWYNALTHNCTTTIRHHVRQVAAGNPFDWRILANGHLDELGYERRQINTSLPFAELRRRSDITTRARAAANSGDFSRAIRDGLPGRPEPAQGARPSVRTDSMGTR
jgi:hypothetical protein